MQGSGWVAREARGVQWHGALAGWQHGDRGVLLCGAGGMRVCGNAGLGLNDSTEQGLCGGIWLYV